MEIVFVDWAPITNKVNITSGGKVRRYFAYTELQKYHRIIPLRNNDNTFSLKSMIDLFRNNTDIWVEYGCGRTAHILVLLSSFIRKKNIILNIHDLAMQERYFNRRRNLVKEWQLSLIENLLLNRATVIILAWPGLLRFFRPKKNQKIIIMPPGIEKEAINNDFRNKTLTGKKALYLGGMKRKDIIPRICSIFMGLEDWKLDLIGLKEGENINSMSNVQYKGLIPHSELSSTMNQYDVILMPLPRNKYTEYILPMKTCYALNTCKPVIMSKLPGLDQFISEIELSSNVIFIDNWDQTSVKAALDKSIDLKIDCEKTHKILANLDWSRRFDEVICTIYNNEDASQIYKV